MTNQNFLKIQKLHHTRASITNEFGQTQSPKQIITHTRTIRPRAIQNLVSPINDSVKTSLLTSNYATPAATSTESSITRDVLISLPSSSPPTRTTHIAKPPARITRYVASSTRGTRSLRSVPQKLCHTPKTRDSVTSELAARKYA